MLMLILYHKYAATALVGFLFFHTIRYGTCFGAELPLTPSDGRDARRHAHCFELSLSETGGKGLGRMVETAGWGALGRSTSFFFPRSYFLTGI